MQDLNEIYLKYFDIVYKFLLSRTHDKDLSEELTQETFYLAVRDINKFKGESKLSSWLCQIAKNLLYKEFNKKRKKPIILEEENLRNVPSSNSVEEKLIEQEEKTTLYKNLKVLDETTKDVILLRITGEKSFKEIGDFFGKSENWARVTFYRGKEKLKEVSKNGDK